MSLKPPVLHVISAMCGQLVTYLTMYEFRW